MEVRVYFYYTGELAYTAPSKEAAVKWITDQAECNTFGYWEEADRAVYDVGTVYYIRKN